MTEVYLHRDLVAWDTAWWTRRFSSLEPLSNERWEQTRPAMGTAAEALAAQTGCSTDSEGNGR